MIFELTIGFILSTSIQKAISYPSLFFSSGYAKRVNNNSCITESYTVLAQKQFYPAQGVIRNNDAVFAMANNSDTQIIVLCGQVSNDGLITVIAASNIAIGMSLTENIAEEIIWRLNSY